MTWVTCDEVIEGDIIRFTEAIWERRGPKRKQRIVRVGERIVTAEVLLVEEQWIYMIVMICEGDRDGEKPIGGKPLEKDEKIKRKVTTVLKRCERLLWSEEPVRAKLTSRFLREPEPEPEEIKKPKKR